MVDGLCIVAATARILRRTVPTEIESILAMLQMPERSFRDNDLTTRRYTICTILISGLLIFSAGCASKLLNPIPAPIFDAAAGVMFTGHVTIGNMKVKKTVLIDCRGNEMG